MDTIDKFIMLIEETKNKAFSAKTERELQKSIVEHAKKLGYRAIYEDILRITLPYHQPLMDIVVEIGDYLHAAELKVMNIKNFKPFEGLDQVLAYSLNGVDYSWLIHYVTFPLNTSSIRSTDFIRFARYLKSTSIFHTPVENVLRTLRIKQIGYMLIGAVGVRCIFKPIEPIEYDQNIKMRQEIKRILYLAQ